MRVILKEPGKSAEARDIENNLETLQSLVGGWIEHVPFIDGVGLIINEEGKLRGMQPNFEYGWDAVVGPAIFVGEADEDFTDIAESGEKKVLEFLRYHAI